MTSHGQNEHAHNALDELLDDLSLAYATSLLNGHFDHSSITVNIVDEDDDKDDYDDDEDYDDDDDDDDYDDEEDEEFDWWY